MNNTINIEYEQDEDQDVVCGHESDEDMMSEHTQKAVDAILRIYYPNQT